MDTTVAKIACAIAFFANGVISQKSVTTITGAEHESVTTITNQLLTPPRPSGSTQLLPASPCLLGHVNCMFPPCGIDSCPSFPSAVCTNDYCGGCFAVYTLNNNALSFDDCHSVSPNNPIVPIDPAPIKPPPIKSNAIVPGISCPAIGSACTSALLSSDRCCSGAQCLYDDIDVRGHRLGVCCVPTLSVGCAKHSDCCAIDGVCDADGKCQSGQSGQSGRGSASAALSVSEAQSHGQFDMFSAEKSGEGASWVRLWIGVFALVLMGGIFSMPLVWCWYYRGRGEKRRVMRYDSPGRVLANRMERVESGRGSGVGGGQARMVAVGDESGSEDEFRDSEDDQLFID